MQLPGAIRALASKGDLTLAAVGHHIVACKRVHRVHTWPGAAEEGAVIELLVLGDHLLSLTARGQLYMWSLSSFSTTPEVRLASPGARPSDSVSQRRHLIEGVC